MSSLREALETGYDELAGEAAAESAAPTEPVTTGAAGHDEPVAPAVVGAEPPEERPRGPDGKFIPKTATEKAPEAPKEPTKAAPATGQAAAGGVLPPSPPPAAPALPELKPPQAWRTMAREKWKSLPREVQEEAIRAENEAKGEIRQRAEAHKNWERFQQTIEPYKQLIAASGHDPVQSAANLFQTAAALQNGNPEQVAGIVAQIINGYGVGRFGPQFVEKVAAHLNGQPGPQIAQQQGLTQADIERIMEERLQQKVTAAREQKAHAQLAEFEANPPEFFDHPGIRQRMARILEANDEEGVDLTYQEAYDLAVASHQEIKKVLEQRAAAKNAATAQAATQRVRAAASSVRTQPTAAPAAEPEGRRAALERAYDDLASR